jgi:hypothetical protein
MEANRLQQAIGQGIAQYNTAQDRDVERRQLELDSQKQPAMKERDLIAIQAYNAGDRSPEVVQYLNARKAQEGPKTQFIPNPLEPGTLKAVPAPNAFGALLGRGEQAPTYDPRTIIDGAPLAPLDEAQIVEQLTTSGGGAPLSPQVPPPSIAAPIGETPPTEVGETPPTEVRDGFASYKGAKLPSSTRYSGSLAEHIKSGETKIDIAKKASEAEIDVAKDIEKEKQKYALAKQKKRPQEEMSLLSTIEQYDETHYLINKALSQTTPYTTGVIGEIGRAFPATKQTDMAETVNSIKADKMLSRLTELKKQGGTLGALAAKEQEALENALASLSLDQSEQQLEENLRRYAKQRQQSMVRIFRAYSNEYGAVPDDITRLFNKDRYLVGQTATNAQGEKVTYMGRGKGWQ